MSILPNLSVLDCYQFKYLCNISFEVEGQSINESDCFHFWRHSVTAGPRGRRTGHHDVSTFFTQLLDRIFASLFLFFCYG